MDKAQVCKLYDTFQASFDPYKVTVWQQKSKEFRDFWDTKLTNDQVKQISESEIDEVIRILDSSGKGNTKESIAVARVMVPQGAWRRLFVELKTNSRLRNLLTEILNERNSGKLMQLIDELYKENAGRKNNLTGPTASVVNAMLFAANPDKYLSVISLKDRKMVIDAFNFSNGPDFQKDSVGRKCVISNTTIINGFNSLGIEAPPRQLSAFLYTTLRPYWKAGVGRMNVGGVEVDVSIPESEDSEAGDQHPSEGRESIVIQAKLAEVGEALGFSIWLPNSDRGRVAKIWRQRQRSLLEDLPLVFDNTVLKIIKNIDVLWINKRMIVRAFEVEDTTSIYSGILRMADLLALQPNLSITTHIVAPTARKDEVIRQANRPVFADIGGHRLAEVCSYLSYDDVKLLAGEKNLKNMKESIVDNYTQSLEDV